jgi:hypothetical protein
MTIYDPELTDDEWREANFPEDVIHSARILGKIATATRLIAYAKQFGVDGVLESAIMLSQDDYRRVEREIRKLPQPKIAHRGPRRARAV